MNSRKIALETLKQIDEGGYSNLVLDKKLSSVEDKRDRSLITMIVYGVLRQRNRLDFIISSFSNRPLKKIDKIVLIALRVAVYQIEFLDNIPPRAAVNETLNGLKDFANRGAVGFANGILRNYIRETGKIKFPDPEGEKVSYLVNYLSHPEWLVNKWLDKYGYNDTKRLCLKNNQIPPLTIRHNSLIIDKGDLLSLFRKNEIEIKDSPIPGSYTIRDFKNISSLPAYKKGGLIIQGQAATLAGLILNPDPGSRVLDMAAAPGGKTTHLAELMENRGELVALDIYDHKIKLINENCNRMGIDIGRTIKKDAREYKSDNLFDYILLDAPCSGLGLIAQKPEIKWNRKPGDIEKLQKLQLELLNRAISLLKEDGELLYSTCTLTEEENFSVVEQFLAANRKKVTLLNINDDLKRMNLENIFRVDEYGFLEMFPPDTDTEGFFLAKFTNRES